jgi:beta-xylosidase
MEMWGPDIFEYNGTFYLNYCVAIFGFNLGAIGLATSPTGLPGKRQTYSLILIYSQNNRTLILNFLPYSEPEKVALH